MKSFLTKEHEIFKQSFRKFLEKEALPFYEEWEKDGMIPRDFWCKLGENGFLCPWVKEEYGGFGADFLYSVIINEELEKIGSSFIGVGLHNDIATPYLDAYGTEEQKQNWLSKCVTGEAISAIAMTEPGAGSDLAALKTTAKKEGNHYVLNGEKTFITNGIHADFVIVACKTDPQAVPAYRGISLLVVERDTVGFTRGKKLKKVGLHAQDTAELIFEDAIVPATNLLGEEGKGFYYLMQQLQQERLIVTIAAQVAIEEILRMTIAYTKERKAFGQSIGQFQHIHFQLVELETKKELSRSFLHTLIREHMEGKDVVTKVSMAKWWTTELLKETASTCMHLHGGYGYMEEYEIARRFRDAQVPAIYAGTTEIMKTIIAKNIGFM